ncbi:PLP-dependent aminotransferase family protein [Xanthomonas sp. A2111]|uniref:PLP-dependent aminotransferase family protein n=1 Tax=Xanthomonas hawaiiensis TaxID=3003247 RepID=A0ABU2IA61_9XANT|nr:PLP-dependent aminotransferase family protein [Xanthomonas sp. A2111]MBO9829194.1 PLP-dependent aminotransferase family protein [Xanthomonas sp. A2111]MDS9995027.1 PLP-dependent aminotransferase family protein [Xanthomonas sp. A2111]
MRQSVLLTVYHPEIFAFAHLFPPMPASPPSKSGARRTRKTAPPATRASGPLIDRIFDDVRSRIEQQSLEIGERLPSVRAMAASMAISNETVLRAYDKLTAAGYLEARRGSGFYVSHGARRVGAPASQQRWSGPSARVAWGHLLEADGPCDGSALGTLPAEWGGGDVLSEALRAVAARPRRSLFDYADVRGWLPLREALSARLRTAGIGASAEQIVTTAGATDALDLVVWSFLYPAQYVLVEEPGPFIHTQRLLASGLWILRVRRLDDGPDLEQLAQLCEKYQPRAFFCSSVLHNPTCTSMSPRKAHQLLKLAEQHDFWIVDDDSHGDLLPRGQQGAVTRLAALDHFERVIHVGSFSKTMAPGLRSGFLAANSQRMERLLLMRSVGAIHSSLLTDQLVHHALTEGGYEPHCEKLRKKLAANGKTLLAKIRTRGWQARDTEGGMYLWTSFGDEVDARAVADVLRADGMMLATESVFSSEGADRHVRLNVARTDDAMLDRIAAAVARVVG